MINLPGHPILPCHLVCLVRDRPLLCSKFCFAYELLSCVMNILVLFVSINHPTISVLVTVWVFIVGNVVGNMIPCYRDIGLVRFSRYLSLWNTITII